MYTYLKQIKCHFLNKIGEQEGRTGFIWGVGTSGKGEDVGRRMEEGEYGADIVYTCI
jgi:hypothetical protein